MITWASPAFRTSRCCYEYFRSVRDPPRVTARGQTSSLAIACQAPWPKAMTGGVLRCALFTRMDATRERQYLDNRMGMLRTGQQVFQLRVHDVRAADPAEELRPPTPRPTAATGCRRGQAFLPRPGEADVAAVTVRPGRSLRGRGAWRTVRSVRSERYAHWRNPCGRVSSARVRHCSDRRHIRLRHYSGRVRTKRTAVVPKRTAA